MARPGRALSGIFGEMLEKLLRRTALKRPSKRALGAGSPTGRLATAAAPDPSPRHFSQSVLTPRRIQHGTKHLIKAGLLPTWAGRTSPAATSRALARILDHPSAVVDHKLGDSAVKGYLGTVDGRTVVVCVFEDGTYAGELASSFVPTPQQMKNWGLT